MNLYKTLQKFQKNKSFQKSDDYYFFIKNASVLQPFECYKKLLYPDNEFDIIRANIVILSILNKNKLDDYILYAYRDSTLKTDQVKIFIQDSMSGRPYVLDNKNKMYVPIFSRIINELYYKNHGKLLKDPYNKIMTNYSKICIDLFETYNFALFDSLFTKFVNIYQTNDYAAYYHFDYEAIYIVNNQGRLEVKISLFDKYLKNPNKDNVIERIKDVAKAYLDYDREQLINLLKNNELISNKLIKKIIKRQTKFFNKKKRREI